ncbi:type VII secretion-associated serine protease mycosin [Streptomyces albus]|uniref:type VII secretion-associated serine protease mycosin n=1 Tax=Streptomyces albus TaxID=1888 RepID=UPI000690BD8E|nr:type VII secretion-associated serine protease mycosin [Streptomyces albus]
MATGCLCILIAGGSGTQAIADSPRSDQWHLQAMRADDMWETSKGKGITVAVIDSGVESSLPDLRGQVLPGKDLSGQEGGAHDDYDGHGTGMAALIAGTGKRADGKATVGLAPESKILPVRIRDGLKARAGEQREQFSLKVSEAIRYAADSEAEIINISLALPANARQQERLADAVRYALDKGKLIFAGVGNSAERDNPVLYPAATPGVVGVAATDKKGETTEESEYGPQVDLAAPGEDMVAACPGGTEVCITHGTSDATALASASAALIWAKYPEWTANQVLRVMINTASGARSGEERTDSIGYGIVRPRIALKDPGDPGPADVYPITGELESGSSDSSGSGAPGERDGDGEPQAAGRAGAGGGDIALWVGLGLGLGAAAVIGGGVAAAVVVSRRRRGATGAAQPSAAVPYQQQYPPVYPYQQPGPPQASQQPYGAPPSPAPPGRASGTVPPPGAPPGVPYPPGTGGG